MKTIPQVETPANTLGNLRIPPTLNSLARLSEYQPRSPLVPVIKTKRKCPVCDHKDWCSVTSDASLAFCMRVSQGSFKTARNGAYMHRLIDTSPAPQQQLQPLQAPTVEDAPRAEDLKIVAAYADLLRLHLVLSEEHRRQLHARGLDDISIEVNGYASTPTPIFASFIARALSREHDLHGIPGFYRDAGEWRMVDYGAGFFIPVRAADSRICGMQIRRDEGNPKYIWFSSRDRNGGASSGSPVSFAKPHLLKDAREVTVTEGALKADIAAHIMNAPVIAAAGVSNFGANFAASLKEQFPQLQTIYTAFDMDFENNEHVRRAMFRLVSQLERARFTVRVRTWPPGWKGIDDYLLAVSRMEVAA
jgi:hypothetical protein